MQNLAGKPHLFFVTGSPGVGKTTLIIKVLQRLKDAHPNLKAQGFYTSELRKDGVRMGFEIISVNGPKGVLASSSLASEGGSTQPMVGKYKVDVPSLEAVALPELEVKGDCKLFIIDEVGKMELFSRQFFPAVWNVLHSHVPVLGSVPIAKFSRDIEEVGRIKKHPQCTLFRLTKQNRDEVAREIFVELNHLIGE